jgi:hypothetical protein
MSIPDAKISLWILSTLLARIRFAMTAIILPVRHNGSVKNGLAVKGLGQDFLPTGRLNSTGVNISQLRYYAAETMIRADRSLHRAHPDHPQLGFGRKLPPGELQCHGGLLFQSESDYPEHRERSL